LNKEILERYYKDQCTPQEELMIFKWLQSKNFEKDLWDFIHEDLSQTLVSKKDLLNKLEPISQSITQKRLQTGGNGKGASIHIVKFSLKLAASLILFGFLTYLFLFITQEKQVVDTEDIIALEKVIKYNEKGRKSKIFLSDGTIVYLNSESKISYPSNFSDSLRYVELEGEAFFEVSPNEEWPFVVVTGPIDIKVLGTSFSVRNLDSYDNIRVSLVSGLIEVIEKQDKLANHKEISLEPQQSISYEKRKGLFTPITSFNPLEEYGWKDGILYFNNAGIQEVVNRLESWYGVNIKIIHKPPFKWNYHGKFQDQSLQNVLESMGYSQEFDFRIKNNEVDLIF
jgi:transmembrane sensor